MLPFLKRAQDAAASAPVESIERKPDEPESQEYDALESAAEELGTALAAKDYKAAATALRAAFQMLESEPHSEA